MVVLSNGFFCITLTYRPVLLYTELLICNSRHLQYILSMSFVVVTLIVYINQFLLEISTPFE